MDFNALITRMTQSACAGNGRDVAACFTPDGVYDDVFYGGFKGGDIATLIEDRFHRDGTRFRWDILSCLEGDGLGMARYLFSYDSRLAGHEGRRAMFEGVAVCGLRDGLISRYEEVAESAVGLSLIGFPDARLGKVLARHARHLCDRPEAAAHIGTSR